METPRQRGRDPGSQREEPSELADRAASVATHDRGIEIERVEPRGEEPNLMLAHLPEERGREPALSEEVEHRDGAIMAGRIVGRAGELVASLSIGYPLPALPVGQDAELVEPPRHHRPKLGVRREPQKAVSLPQLTVLVPAAHDEGVA